jgi:hypothetical protein
VAFVSGSVLAQERTGSLGGTVADPTGLPVPNAAVEVASPALLQPMKSSTDAGGAFLFPSLPPGSYEVSISAGGFRTYKASGVTVNVGRTIRVDARLEVGQVTESVTVSGETLMVDTATTTVSSSVTAAMYDRLPKSRSFDSLIVLAPGVRNEPKAGGFQVDGSSGSEHAWILDGIEVTNIQTGDLPSYARFPTEWVAETQMKSSGFDAQYGGAIGGVVNATTRSGANDFHGQISFYTYTDEMNARVRPRLRLNPADDRIGDYFHDGKDDVSFHNPVLQLGGPIKRNMLWFFASVTPQFTRRERDVTFLRPVQTSHYRQDTRQDFTLGKIDFQPSSRLRGSFSYIYDPLRVTGLLPSYEGTDPVASPWGDRGYRTPATSFAYQSDYTASSKLVFSVFGGRQYSNYKDYGIPRGTRYRYANGNTALPITPQLPGNVLGPAGNFTADNRQTVLDEFTRNTVHAIGSYLANFGGQHNFKFGWDLNRLHNSPNAGTWPDGYVFVYWDRSYTAQTRPGQFRGRFGYYINRAFATEGNVASNNQGIFFNDTWRVNKNWTLSLGLRTEREFLPSFDPSIQVRPIEFGFQKKMAPRLGFAWDPTGQGRMRFGASWGLYYDMMKYEMPRGSFGGDKWLDFVFTLDDPNIFNIKPTGNGFAGCQCPGTRIETVNWRIPSHDPKESLIEPDLKPVRLQAWNVTWDYSFRSNYLLALRYVHRQIDTAIEDVGSLTDQGETYFIANPGFGITIDPKKFPTPPYPPQVTPKAKRDYDAVEVRLERRFTRQLGFQANYTWSRLYGNYAGLANSDENGRRSPNVNRVYDLPWMAYDQRAKLVYGRLATDRPHSLGFFGSYDWKTKGGTTRFSPIFQVSSGTPLTTEASVQHVPVFIFGRGDLGRTSAYTETNLLVSHEVPLKEGKSFRVELNVLNLFNHGMEVGRLTALDHANDGGLSFQTEADIFKGYDTRALMSTQKLRVDPRHNVANQFLGPRTLRFGFHFLF